MGTIGTKWIDDLRALTGLPAPDELEKRTAASVRALAQGGYDDELKALVAMYNADQQAPVPTGHPLWRSGGWFGVRFDAIDLVLCQRMGLRWIAGVTSHGVNQDGSHAYSAHEDIPNQTWLAGGGVARAHSRGLAVIGWQWNQGKGEPHTQTEAWIADQHVRAFGLDGYIANGEEDWKGNEFPGVWAARFKALTLDLPNLAVAWSTLGAATGTNVYPFDYGAFLSRGWDIMPQAYPQQSPEYWLKPQGVNGQPGYQQGTVEHSIRAGIPIARFHPTIADYLPQVPGAFRPTMDQWVDALEWSRIRGVRGFSLWAHDWSADEVARLAPLMGL